MAINIKFDLAGNPEPPTIILAKRNGNKLGQLEVEPESIELNDKLNDASELSFTLYKYIDNRITNLWDEVVDFKLIYCKEWDMWFEITVELDEETETIKTVMCTQLGQAELSQIMLYDIHINEEGDSNWNKDNKEYKSTILYCPEDTSKSLLHRLLKDKAPHYSIIHVDDTIKNIQRTFSFDNTSIYDAFMDIAEEIGCLFIFHSNSDENGNIQRTISVYDLQQNCMNTDCWHRGEFIDKCPKCGSTNIKYGYGQDTTIFVTADELAASGIQLATDTDSVKNCFKLEAGDDLMTATVRNCNPNGTNYIWYFSNDMKKEMSEELVERIESYDLIYNDYYNNHEFKLDVSGYNALVNKYKIYDEDLQIVPTSIKGYSSLMNIYYNVIDLGLYLESGLMPSPQISETDATKEGLKLTSSSLSPVAVPDLKIVSLATADSAVKAMAKVIVKPTFKVEIVDKSSTLSSISNGERTWKGKFLITNYSDEEDTYTTNTISVTINDDLETVTKQKIEKALKKEDTDDVSITGLFKKEYDLFRAELKKYALNPLKSFYEACQACIDILIEQGAGDKTKNKDLYDKLYTPYYNKLTAIEDEIAIRENEVNLIKGVYKEDGALDKDGFQTKIEKLRKEVQNTLDFETYLGKDLLLEFCAYRREDTYSNNNYVSDGLSNAKLFERAKKFIQVANDEIYKSAELQHSISTSLKNLLAIPKFKILVEYFENGNWFRVQIDDYVYKLRLLEYNINFGSFDEIPVEFSDITKIKNGITDVSDILSQASSMATSYSSVQRQASQGEEVKGTIDTWITAGLNSALVRIQSNDNEEITMTKNGLLCRSYNDVTETYDPEQLKLTHNIMAYTTDNWKTVSAALGKHDFVYFDNNKIKQNGTDYGLTARFVTAGNINGSQIIGGEIYSENYTSTTGTYMNLNDGTFSWAGGRFKYDGSKISLDGEITTTSGKIGGWTISSTSLSRTYESGDTTRSVFIQGYGNDSSNAFAARHKTGSATDWTYDFYVRNDGKLYSANADIKGKITATSGKIANWDITTDSIKKETTIDDKKIITGMQQPNSGTWAFFAGTYNGSGYSDCEFRVSHKGKLYASGAEIGGKITASSGSITGNLTVSGSLTHTRGNYTVTLRAVPSTVTNGVFYITDKSSGSSTYPFIVNGDGSFKATKATISGDSTFGGELKAASGTFKGTLSAVNGTFTSLSAGKSSFSKNQVIIDASYMNSDGEEIAKGSVYIGRSGVTGWEDITMRPSGDNVGNIGTAGKSWDTLYVKNGAVQSSDRNYKKDISKMGEKQEQLFNLLSPVTFKFIDSTYDRYHYGFISQEVEDAINKCGLTTKDFAGFCKDIKRDENGLPVLDKDGNQEYIYSLRYNEFIALNTYMIQKLNKRIIELENEVQQLKK